MHSYMVSDGSHVFACLASPKYPERRAKWGAFPDARMCDGLRTFLLFHGTIRGAHLVGTGRFLGLRAQHWQGHVGSDKLARRADAWVSVDRRFPAVLEFTSVGRTSTVEWQITRLDISHPVPAYVFLPLLHPKPGLKSMLTARYLPLEFVFVWHILLLACYTGLAFSFAPAQRFFPRRAILAVLSAAVMSVAFLRSPRVEVYFYQLIDAPVLLLLGLLSVAFLFGAWRAAGGRNQLPMIGKASWPLLFWAILACGLGFVWQFGHSQGLANVLGLKGCRVPFLPVMLLNVMLFAAPSAAFEELLFRGCIYGWLERRCRSTSIVVLVQALAFSAFHIPRSLVLFGAGPRMAIDLVIMFLFGVGFGLLRRGYRGLLAPWLVHFAYNTAVLYMSTAALCGFMRAISSI
jgi:membrane protease YdiL (CAAX protease family)